MIIDSHCHLNYDPMSKDLESVLGRAIDEGVKYFLTISTEDKGFSKILDIVNTHKSVYCSYGIHPHESKLHLEIKCKNILEKIKLNKKIIGIGETGLDFYYNHSSKKEQIKMFIEHIHASQISKLPLIVHSRSAESETLEILRSEIKNNEFKILMHCFTGSREFAHSLLDLNSYISASGVITFKKSLNLANIFKEIPNEKILVETDCPYLAPEPLRGKSNEPSYIIHTVKFLAKIKKMNISEISNITSKNFFQLFGKLSDE